VDREKEKFRRLEKRCDVNPLSPKHRRSNAFEATSSYRSNFVNFFPAPTEQSGKSAAANETFWVEVKPRGQQEQQPQEVLPFDIATRDPATEVAVSSEYRDHFIDFGKDLNGGTKAVKSGKRGERPRCLREVWDGGRGK
jgi:hypothetical protein